MTLRSLPAFLIAAVLLSAALAACRRGGGVPPCRDQSSAALRRADGAFVGDLRVAAGPDGLAVAFRPADGRPFDGAYLIGSGDATWRLPSEGADGSALVPWDGIADDVCGQLLTVALAFFPSQAVTIAIACPDSAPTEAATSTGGAGGGGYCQP